MNNHCHSPNPRLIFHNSKCTQLLNNCNDISDNICLTNYGSPSSHINFHTECNKPNNKTKITYQLDSDNSSNKTLKKNQSMLYQNMSPEITFSNKNNILSKSNSSTFSIKKNENIKNNINKKNELLEKIRYISNRIDKTINLYKDRNNGINKPQQNTNPYSRKIKYSNRNCSENYPLNFQYNNNTKLDSMKKENDRHNELSNMKLRNLSQVVNEPINLYKKMDTETKKRKYDKLYKQRKFYDNNINLKNVNNNRNATYMYDPCLQNTENIIANESAKKKSYQVIKNMKRNIYQRDMNDKCPKSSYYSERNKHKYNKNISEYIYATRRNKGNNNNYNNHYYKEIIHKNTENSYDNNDEIRNNDSNNIPFNENNYEKQEENENNMENRPNNCPQEMNEEYQNNETNNSLNNEQNVNNNMNENYNCFDNNQENCNNDENIKDAQIKKLNEELNTNKVNYVLLENRYNELLQENESLKKEIDVCAQDKSDYESHLADLEQKLEICCQKNQELEQENKNLLCELNTYKNIDNQYNILKNENENIIIDNKKLNEQIENKEREFQNLMHVNDEEKSNFDNLLVKHNNLLEQFDNINKENGQIKNELYNLSSKYDKILKNLDEVEFQRKSLSSECDKNIDKYNELNDAYNELIDKYKKLQDNAYNLEKQIEKLKRLNEDKDICINNITKENDINKKKIDNLNNKINILSAEKNEGIKKYNNMHSLYKEVTREVNKLERRLRENELELNNAKKDSNNLKDKNRKYNDDNNKLFNKINNIQEELNSIKEENESLKNQNKSLVNDNESMFNENKNNNDVISEYKRIIEKLKKENNDLNNTLKSRKYNVSTQSKSSNSKYADEIVIVNKETTYSKGLFDEPNEFNKYGQIQNRYEIKRNANTKSGDLLKYHEIIQDLSNMILIYEKFFFKDKVKPKNNRELFCYLLVQYINEKFKSIKAKVFLNLLFYNNNNENSGRTKKNILIRRNNSNLGSLYDNNINSYTERGISRKRGYFTARNRINNNNY